MTEQPQAADTEYRVEATGIKKSFGDNHVLRGVSFRVPRGTATTIIGPSGYGKTTLLRALNALDVPDAGVEPDVLVPPSADDIARGVDTELEAARVFLAEKR